MSFQHDFKIYRAQIPSILIDELLVAHERFKHGMFSIFRAQGTTQFEYPKLDKFGNQINSIQNPHLLGYQPKFRKAVERIIYSHNVSECLSDFTGSDSHVNYQSMFFDKSTGTKLHQDTWYLDTEPAGQLVGVWFALEAITKESGPFCLYSKAANKRVGIDDFDFENLEKDPSFVKRFPNFERFDFLPQRGDILIWKSFTIHGAHKPSDQSKTRKSLTAHFYPSACKVQDPPAERILSIYDHKRPKPTNNPKIAKAAVVNPMLYSSMCLALNKLGGLSNVLSRDNKMDGKTSQIRRIG